MFYLFFYLYLVYYKFYFYITYKDMKNKNIEEKTQRIIKIISDVGGPSAFSASIADFMPDKKNPSKQRINNWMYITGVPYKMAFIVEQWAKSKGLVDVTAKYLMGID